MVQILMIKMIKSFGKWIQAEWARVWSEWSVKWANQMPTVDNITVCHTDFQDTSEIGSGLDAYT